MARKRLTQRDRDEAMVASVGRWYATGDGFVSANGLASTLEVMALTRIANRIVREYRAKGKK